MRAVREYLAALGSIAALFAFAAVAGGIVGTFFYVLFSVANMAPGR